MTLTDLDQLAIGSTVASKAVDTDGVPTTFGMVVDFGLHDTGEPFVDLLVEVSRREVKVDVTYKGAKPKAINVAQLTRIDVVDLDPSTVEEPQPSRMEGWVGKALVGEVVLPGHTFVLAYIAAGLRDEAAAVNARRHAGTQTIVDEFNEALAAKRAEREERAS